jgi:peptide/nickel transport system substrate-binding protein
MFRIFRAILATLVILLLVYPAHGKTLRLVSQYDPSTLDPHAAATVYNARFTVQVYEPLVQRDEKFRHAPALALSWSQPSPTIWRFSLRAGVKFHDGTPFTADDIVFSIERIQAPTSQRKSATAGIIAAKRIDDLTVELTTDAPNPILLNQLPELRIMSRAWCIKNNTTRPQDYNAKEETYAVRNANGTGPYMLKSYQPDVRTVLVANPSWWGKRGNVDEAHFIVVQSSATRLAALISGEADIMMDPSYQDIDRMRAAPGFKILEGQSIATFFLGMDLARDELIDSNVKGRNPFKDVRVRKAIYHAIDIEALKGKVLRGLARPAGLLIGPLIEGYSAQLDQRLAFDRTRARQLLEEAGYPNGFEVTLDCGNNQPAEQVCQAITAMLSQVGILVRLNIVPIASYFQKLSRHDTSFYYLGWTGGSVEIYQTLRDVVHTITPDGNGRGNQGRYSNAKLDVLIDRLKIETDPERRRTLVNDALTLTVDDLPVVPLFQLVSPWAMRDNVRTIYRPNNVLETRWVNID